MLRERDITQEKTTDPEKCNLKVKTTSYNLIKDEREQLLELFLSYIL